jgi:glycosyltransferase involved in cell wall biosynthesis
MAERSGLTFATFFPGCSDIHLTKDVGMIPYIMHRDFGYNSYIICYKNGDYPLLEKDVAGLKMLFLDHHLPLLERLAKRTGSKPSIAGSLGLLSTLIDAFIFLIRCGKKIDVLQLYHPKSESILVGFIYRIINRKGVLYLKLDLDMRRVAPYRDHPGAYKTGFSIRRILFDLASFDIISVETKEVFSIVLDFFPFFKNHRDQIHYVPNGIDVKSMSSLVKPFSSKKDEILHVGRIGDRQKASELALEAFSKICIEFPNWKLALIGPMESTFFEFLEGVKAKNILAANRIPYLGFVERAELYRRYSEAKILIIPSRWESFGLVAAEAGVFGDVILGSDIPPFRDLTDNGKLGYLCPVDSLECLTDRLRYMLAHNEELEAKSNQTSEFIRKNFDWRAICGEINNLIQGSIGNRSMKK